MCSLGLQAGLFSAVTSAFVIQVAFQLQPDPNEETAALLRVLIHKIDNTTFNGDVPTVPRWSGPPRTIVQVEAILYASLAASLFSAFLAMLGKQWLNRYASIDMRGSAIGRSQNRQLKLDGIITWYFDHVMEALPVILQFALLLLGCALSLYLRGIERTVASVVIGATSFGVAFYAFIVVAGAASLSCPYQTPGAHILRRIWRFHIWSFYVWRRHVRNALHSASHSVTHDSAFVKLFTHPLPVQSLARWRVGIAALPFHIASMLPALATDAYHLVRALVWVFVALARRVSRRATGLFCGGRKLRLQTAVLDSRCILWVLQTSLDKDVHLLTLRSLATMTTLGDFNPVLVSACFDSFIRCVVVLDHETRLSQGLEELAEASALCLLRTFSHLAIVDPTSSVLKDVRRRYTTTFPSWTDFTGFPSRPRFAIIHRVLYSPLPPWLRGRKPDFWRIQWPSSDQDDHARDLAKLAQFEYQKRGRDPNTAGNQLFIL